MARGHPRGENGWGGEDRFTEAGRERAIANLRPELHDPLGSTTHGLKRWLTRTTAPPCRFCVAKDDCEAFSADREATCRLAETYQAAIIDEVLALPQVDPAQDRGIVLEYAKTMTALAIVDSYLSHVGMFRDSKGAHDVQPVYRERTRLSQSLLRLAAELGLTPASRARLGVGKDGTLDKLASALETMNARQAAATTAGAIDAEYSANDESEAMNHECGK